MQGSDWWKFLAYVDGKRGDWFEFQFAKTSGSGGDAAQWEAIVGGEQDLTITPNDVDHRAQLPKVGMFLFCKLNDGCCRFPTSILDDLDIQHEPCLDSNKE